jgi:hypothetical protein
MDQREPNLVHSSLSRMVTKDGVTVEVSTVWDDLFPSDQEAYEEFERTVAKEGIRTSLDGGKIIPFRR